MRAVFLDIDNTLLDFDEYVREAMRTGFARFGLRPYEPWMYDIFTEENNALWHRIELGTLTFERLQEIRWNMIFARLSIEADGIAFETFFRDALFESAIPVPGARALLEALYGRCLICAASNGPYEQQLHRLELADMRRYFDGIYISERLGVSKPDPLFFTRAFAELNEGRAEPIPPGDCLILGDSLTSDMESGLRFGMKTAFYNRNGKPVPPEIDLSAGSLPELTELLLRSYF